MCFQVVVRKLPKTTEEWADTASRDQALLQLTEQNIILDQTEADDLDLAHPVRSVSSNLIATQLNFISKTYRHEYNECVRVNNIKPNRVRYENSEEYVPVCKKIDQHLEKQPHSMYIDSDIINFAGQNQDYESLSREAKMALNLARIEVLHLELQMEKYNFDVAKKKVCDVKIRDIVCGICLDEFHPGIGAVVLVCGHAFCASCLVKDKAKTCAVCTTSKNQLEFRDLFFKFNLEYNPICRFCLIPFTDQSEISFLNCGHVYCTDCVHKLDGVCFCGRFLNAFNMCQTLYPSFN